LRLPAGPGQAAEATGHHPGRGPGRTRVGTPERDRDRQQRAPPRPRHRVLPATPGRPPGNSQHRRPPGRKTRSRVGTSQRAAPDRPRPSAQQPLARLHRRLPGTTRAELKQEMPTSVYVYPLPGGTGYAYTCIRNPIHLVQGEPLCPSEIACLSHMTRRSDRRIFRGNFARRIYGSDPSPAIELT
jgi:hypothetical protein